MQSNWTGYSDELMCQCMIMPELIIPVIIIGIVVTMIYNIYLKIKKR